MAATAYTLSLFDRVAPPARPRLALEVPPGRASDPDGLRPYQRTAVTRIGEELAKVRSTLLVMATGTGKTQTFGAMAKHWTGRVLVLAHRDELIQQARSRLAKMTGEWVGIEQAEWHAQAERIVVGSVQTLSRAARLSRFAPDRFALVIVDEAHHAVATTYRKILAHFAGARVLGVTATPDRGDERAMEQVFDSVAFKYEINDGIKDSWLCPVEVKAVRVGAIDLSSVKTTAGDLNQGQLDAVMASEEALHGIARPTIELAGDRRTILFTTSVDNAHRLAEVLNRYRPGSARAVDGGTSFDARRSILRGHRAGEFQYLCNVGVLTEGYDDPGVACIVNGRPTKSRALYAQMIGRGLRFLPECDCDVGIALPAFPRWCAKCGGSIGYPIPGDAAGRRARMLDGPKRNCVVLDFVGNSGRHSLISALDILGGKWDDEVVQRAKTAAEDGGPEDADELLRRAQASIEEEQRKAEAAKRAAAALRIRIKAKKVDYHALEVDPFGSAKTMKWSADKRPASPAQVDAMHRWRLDVPPDCTLQQASRMLAQAVKRKQKGLSSYGQIRNLSRYSIDGRSMYESTAFEVLRAIGRNGGRAISPEAIASIVASREPGSDG